MVPVTRDVLKILGQVGRRAPWALNLTLLVRLGKRVQRSTFNCEPKFPIVFLATASHIKFILDSMSLKLNPLG